MKTYNKVIALIILLIILVIAIFWALSIGSVYLEQEKIYITVIKQFSSGKRIEEVGQGPVHDIIWLLRMPRLILAACAGAGLAVCGVIMQAIVKNPLADPYILGISSGASLGATLAILLGIGVCFGENFVGICAFIGAFLISVLVLFIANIGGSTNSVKLLLAGMALSAVCSSFSSFIVYFADNKEGIQSITYWLLGSFAGAKWGEIMVIAPIMTGGILFFWTQSRMLNLMLLGDNTAVTLGTDLRQYRQIYLLISALMVGFIVYAAGMIGFVGLLVPHIVRAFSGPNHRFLLPLSALLGAIFLVIADGLCRSIIAKTEIPVGIIISLVGAPGFVYLIISRSYGFGGNDK